MLLIEHNKINNEIKRAQPNQPVVYDNVPIAFNAKSEYFNDYHYRRLRV